MAKNVLEVKDLSVAYGKVEAVSKLSLNVGEGKIVTVIGPNGAGKTTTLAAIMGLLPSSGQVEFDGTIEGEPEVERMVVRGMNLVPEKRELFGSMSIEDNLLLGAFQRHRLGHQQHQSVQRAQRGICRRPDLGVRQPAHLAELRRARGRRPAHLQESLQHGDGREHRLRRCGAGAEH